MECWELRAYGVFVPLSEEGSCGAVVPLSLSTDSICFLLLFESLMGLTLEVAVIDR